MSAPLAVSFGHSPAIWQEFPQLVPGVLVVDGVRADVNAEPVAAPWRERARARLDGAAESELPEVAAWRRAYARMGLKPTQYRSAAEALLRRFRREGALPQLHPLVDLGNAVSLAFALPVAILDADAIAGPLEVRHAAGDEQYESFGGEVETPEPGEVIFADAARHAHARRWTFRQSRRSTVGPGTQRALIVAEALHATGSADVAAVLDALADGVTRLWGPPLRAAVLTAPAPRIEVSFAA